jgi:predicted RND superfamily exporter protein
LRTYQKDMKSTLLRIYDKYILEHPVLTLIVTFGILAFFAFHVPNFKLDASGDSLVLENDADLYYHRQITERYRVKEILVLTYTARDDLFSSSTLDDLAKLRDELRLLENVSSVTTILDVPLLLNSGASLDDLADEENIKTLENSHVDKSMALAEFNDNPLYSGRLVSTDGKTTALLINLPFDETYRSLLKRRDELREKKYNNDLSAGETQELEDVAHAYRQELTRLMQRDKRLVEDVRTIMGRHSEQADLYLGGVPMIVADMISFIESDLVLFGVGVMFFLIITLAVIFRKLRWVILSMLCCLAAVLVMVGVLGLVDWRVTVISSNFISLMLILTMSLNIHLIERYLEVHSQSPYADQRTLVLETVRTIALPCLYTMLTTMVAFASLLVSGIRPVIDFGMMMTLGLMISFGCAFVMLPASVVLLEKDNSGAGEDFSHPFTLVFARITEAHGKKILALSIALAVISTLGIMKLKVENRFIDYFREKTEIFQGMSLIDSKLGGTTPLDLIVDFDIEPLEFNASDFDDNFFGNGETEKKSDYWISDVIIREEIEEIHDYLDSLPETGEVLSFATLEKLTTLFNGGQSLDGFDFSILLGKTPTYLEEQFIYPYMSEDTNQVRFAMRIIESGKKLERKVLLDRIRDHLVNDLGYGVDQVRFTNMFVLYNNMLQSLFQSQILTIGIVFLAIMLMFVVLFRSVRLAVIAIIPNLLPAAMVLGTMGWLSIPLNMMTITIASITIGIAVDNTIHYIHRFQKEFPRDHNYMAAIYRCHCSIGRAMYYTSITISIGFSILVISNFVPTIYFGLSTGFAMLVALLAALTLLPQLLILLKPLGPENKQNKQERG